VRDVLVVDLYGLECDEVRSKFPAVYQHVYERVKPERDQNPREVRRKNWWIFGEPNPKLRHMLFGLSRYISTVETSKYRFFVFLDQTILPDNMLVNVAMDDAYDLGVLSSRLHICWALATGGILGPTPRYNKTRCFETFPFPVATDAQKAKIRDLAEHLDAHRKRQQAEHPDLTMTGMYNVLEKLRAGDPLTDTERKIHEQGLVSVLKQLHDDLDAAVFSAYGWPVTLTDQQILEKLVALNAERAAEEAQGKIRWLRPEYQCRGEKAQQTQLDVSISGEGPRPALSKVEGPRGPDAKKTAKPTRQPWPKELPEQVRLLRERLATQSTPVTAQTLAKSFTRARVEKVEELLQALVTLGQARLVEGEMYLAG
jgi:hypothetical protein